MVTLITCLNPAGTFMRLALPRKNMKVELVEGLLQETYMIAIRQAGFNRAYAYSGLGISSNT